MRPGIVAAIGLLLLTPARSPAQSRSTAARSATARLVQGYMRDQHVPGASVAIVVADSLVYARGFGWANLEDSVAVTTQTRFPTASTLKLLTATAILQLAERGKLALDKPVQTYCPSYPPKPYPVTIDQLLVHQGGIRPSVTADVMNRTHFSSIRAAVAGFGDDSLVAVPGTRQVYSNAGYVLLACAIEGASGQTYAAYLRTHVLVPAGMTATEESSIYRVIPHRAGAYMVRTEANTRNWEGLWTPAHLAETELDVPFRADPLDESFATGASNYLTTPGDLARWVIALDRGRLLSVESRAGMFSDHPTADGQSTGRGYAWVVSDSGGRKVARLAGSVWIGSSAVLFVPEGRFAAIVCTNLGFQQPSALLDSLAVVWGRD